mgnify:CR=1 FL=1
MALFVKKSAANIIFGGDLPSDDRAADKNILACRVEIEGIIDFSGAAVNIDLDQLQGVSSTLLSLMLCLLRYSKQRKCELMFLNMPQGLFNMARVGGVESFFPHFNH